jgi:hypothetical protein
MQTMRILLLVGIQLLLKNALITAMPNVFVCANEVVILDDFLKNNAKERASYWRNDNISIGLVALGVGKIPQFVAINTTTENSVATVIYTTINQSGRVETLCFTITVRPKPLVMFSTLSATLCSGIAYHQTITSMPKGANFKLTNDNPDVGVLAITNANGLTFSPFNANREKKIANISVTPVLNGCVGVPQFVELTVLQDPSVYPPSDTIICSGSAISTVFSGNLPETTFNWTNDNPEIGLPSNGSGNLNFTTAANLSGENQVANIVVTPQLNGCDGVSKSFFIVVKPAPTLDKTVFSFCVNDSGAIAFKTNLKIPKATTFNWTSSNVQTGVPPSGGDSSLIFKALSNKTTEVVTTNVVVTTTADGCKTQTQAVINIKPRPVLFNPGNLFIAAGQPVVLHFTADMEGTTFDWTNDKSAIGLPLTGSGDLSFRAKNNDANTPITANIVATPNLNGCTEQAQMFTITLPPTPSVSTPLATIPSKTGEK